MKWRLSEGLLWLFLPLALSGCVGERDLQDMLPGGDLIAGWTPAGEVQIFDVENLYDLVDGQANAFFAYGFERVAVQDYEDADAAIVRVEVWQLQTSADAYGLFSTHRTGMPVAIGNGGDADPGRRLDFWQDRYFVRVFAASALEDATIHAFAEGASRGLPTGGEKPSLVGRLPIDGLIEGSDIFFRQEISIQDYLWLGGQNLLALGPETAAVLARYEVGGEEGWLVLVEYPDTQATTEALEALQESRPSTLKAARVHDELLGAVFGGVAKMEAETLLTAALDSD
jgi:hypothetical protein